jgi:hypothetical protein
MKSKLQVRHSAAEKDVYVYEDHRVILQVLHSAVIEKKIKPPVNLVYFDYHADDKPPLNNHPMQTLLKQYRKQLPAEREFWSFVEWDCDTLDGDWLKVGMEIGLIQNALVVGCQSDGTATEEDNQYKDHTGQNHHIYNFGHLWDRWLNDAAKAANYSDAWDLLGWKLSQGKFDFDAANGPPLPLILDFDLDCFSVPGPEGEQRHIPWPTDTLFELFTRPLPHWTAGLNYGRFLQALAERASLITIARESAYCGGFQASARLLRDLDMLLFSGLLD